MSDFPGEGSARRRSDWAWSERIRDEVRRRVERQGVAVSAGQALLVATGLITTSTVSFVDPGLRMWSVVGLVSAVMTGVLVGSAMVPWPRFPPSLVLAFPGAVAAAVAGLGFAGHDVGMSYTGLLVLCFAYLGLTMSSRIVVAAVPVNVCSWVAANDGWSARYVPRLSIAVLIWLCLGLLLAQLMARQRQLSQRLVYAANTDALTGVPNRRSLSLRLATMTQGDTLILCDLDHFKTLNDSLGHAAGDRALADFGRGLRASLRESDFCARYGGEEFVLVLPDTNHNQAQAALDRLRRHWALLQPGLTFSAGIATCHPGRDVSETLAAADACLYQAKAEGRDRDHHEAVSPAPSSRNS